MIKHTLKNYINIIMKSLHTKYNEKFKEQKSVLEIENSNEKI